MAVVGGGSIRGSRVLMDQKKTNKQNVSLR